MRARSLRVFGLALGLVVFGGACTAVLGIEEAELDTSSNTTSSTSGSGGGECQNASDCSDNKVCTTDSCQAGVCRHDALNLVDADPSAQTQFDCKKVICLDGNASNIADQTDLPNDSNDCTDDSCNGTVPVHTNSGVNTVCTSNNGKVCNGLGNCVECVTSANCTPPEICNVQFGTPYMCACPRNCQNQGRTCGFIDDGCGAFLNCNDNQHDGTETDRDCGGLTVPNSTCDLACTAGKICNVNADCASNVCNGGPGGTCQ